MNKLFETFSPKDFAAVLPSTSREYVISLLEAGADPMQVAIQLSNEPGEGLATKGGGLWPRDIMPRIVREIHILLCTNDQKYTTLRDRLNGEVATSANIIVYLISNSVAIHAGMAPALCVPLIALVLAAVAKVGLAAWCQAVTQSQSMEMGLPLPPQGNQPSKS